MTASVFSKKGLQASTTKKIQILPALQEQPPLSPSDFPGEYFFAASTPQQSKYSLGRAPSFGIEIAGEEPEAIVLDPHSSSSGSTKIHVVVKALPRPSTLFDPSSFPSQCQLRARLVTKTLITPDRIEEKAIPTIEQAKYGDNASLRLHKSDEQEFTVGLPHWNHIAPGSYLQPTQKTNSANTAQTLQSNLRSRTSPSYSTSQRTKHPYQRSLRRCCQGVMHWKSR